MKTLYRIMIDKLTPPEPIPLEDQGKPARRQGDVLYPDVTHSQVQKQTLLYQEFDYEIEVEAIISLLNGLKVEELCANCGHERALHVGGIGKCSSGGSYLNIDACRCETYVTRSDQLLNAARASEALAQSVGREAQDELRAARAKLDETQHTLESARKMNGTLQYELLDTKALLNEAQKDLRASRKIVRDTNKRRGK